MNEREYLIAKASRELTNEDYKRKRNRNLLLGAAGLAGGAALSRRAGVNLIRGQEIGEHTTKGLRTSLRGAQQAVGGGAATAAGLGFGGAGIYRAGQARSTRDRG